MKKIYSVVTAFLISMVGFSQDTVSTNKDLYKTTIYSATLFNKNTILARDYLVQVTDSTVSLSSKPLPFYLPDTGNRSLRHFSYSDIESIDIRKKGSAGRGALAGFLIGAGFGIISGLASGDDKGEMLAFSAGEKAIALGLTAGGTGALVGLFVGGLAHKKFYINRKKERLKEMNTTLLERIYSPH